MFCFHTSGRHALYDSRGKGYILLTTRNNVAPKTLLHPVSTASDFWLRKIKIGTRSVHVGSRKKISELG